MKNKTNMLIAAALLLALLMGCAAAAGAAGTAETAGTAGAAGTAETAGTVETAGTAEGLSAPDFTLELYGEGSVTLSALRGKPVLLNVFTTWCPPCLKEMPFLQKAFETYGEEVQFIGVSVGESKEDVADFMADGPVTYPIALDPSGVMAATYKVEFIPQTWILDADGVIAAYIPGGMDEKMIQEALAGVLP